MRSLRGTTEGHTLGGLYNLSFRNVIKGTEKEPGWGFPFVYLIFKPHKEKDLLFFWFVKNVNCKSPIIMAKPGTRMYFCKTAITIKLCSICVL